MNLRSLLSATVLLLGAWSARADDFDRHVADIHILQLKAVQRELGVSEDQRARMNQAADQNRADLKAYSQQLDASKGKPDESRVLSYYLQLKDQVLNDLTPQQVRRLREITLQRAGFVGLADGVVARRVGLSAAQLKAVRQDIVSGEKQARELTDKIRKPIIARYKNANPKTNKEARAIMDKFDKEMAHALGPKLKSLEQAHRRKMLALLTPAQTKAWKALQGRPFTLEK
jgi:hypothetical protein